MQDTLVSSLDHVEILEKIGEGSYGSVFKAHQGATGEVIAIKTIAFDEADDNSIKSVEREIDILRQCKHANIVGYKGSFLQDQLLYIAMEFCEVGSCSEAIHVTGRPFNEQQILFVLREALKGLQYLHSIKKLHRDIKGGNILLTSDGQVKLADFGVSVQLQNTVSKANTFIGTPYWMAPEIILGKPYNAKADVWSMGITAIELADMLPPFADVHPMRVLFFIPNGPSPKPKNADKLSPSLLNLIDAMLVKDPSKRPNTSSILDHPALAKANGRSLIELAEEVIVNKPKLAEIDETSEGSESEPESEGAYDSGTLMSKKEFHDGTVISTGTFMDKDVPGGTMVVREDDFDAGTCVVRDDAAHSQAKKETEPIKLRGMFDTVESSAGAVSDGEEEEGEDLAADIMGTIMIGAKSPFQAPITAHSPGGNMGTIVMQQPRIDPHEEAGSSPSSNDKVDFSTIVRFSKLTVDRKISLPGSSSLSGTLTISPSATLRTQPEIPEISENSDSIANEIDNAPPSEPPPPTPKIHLPPPPTEPPLSQSETENAPHKPAPSSSGHGEKPPSMATQSNSVTPPPGISPRTHARENTPSPSPSSGHNHEEWNIQEGGIDHQRSPGKMSLYEHVRVPISRSTSIRLVKRNGGDVIVNQGTTGGEEAEESALSRPQRRGAVLRTGASKERK